MSARQLILLSPYRLPTHTTLYLADDDVAAFLNGYSALWHPALLAGAEGPPRLASPYDHDQPAAGQVFAIPESPPLMLPDDWEQRAKMAGALVFKVTPDRATTFANLMTALQSLGENAPSTALRELDVERLAPFLGIGFGLLQMEALFEAMSHDNVLAAQEFWQDVQQAVEALGGEDVDAPRRHLQAAANRLLEAREVVYQASIHLVDLAMLDELGPDCPWPLSLLLGVPCNVLAAASIVERLARDRPERFAELRERVAGDLAEVCGGPYCETEDALRPMESQLWNLLRGQAVYRETLGQEVRVFARKRFGAHPQLPMLLQGVGLARALLISFDESVLPAHRVPIVSCASSDGKQVDAYTRVPLAADSPQTYFHLPYHLYQTLMHDQSATLALLHRSKPAAPWYEDWIELSRLAPVFGKWATLTTLFNEVPPGDYASPAAADEFHGEYLLERSSDPQEREAVSGFAAHLRARRRLDTAWTLAALYRGLGGRAREGIAPTETDLARLEDHLESTAPLPIEPLTKALDETAAVLARRLVARGPAQAGCLLLNPCSFKRRVALELPDLGGAVLAGGPVKASQWSDGIARLVVEVPALGFAWFPCGGSGGPSPPAKIRLADERAVRNEFFEAEIDPATGGLRAFRDHRSRTNRIGQQLVFNPGSAMRMQGVKVNSTGPALGEVVTEGVLLDAQETVLATWRQRYRAWIGRPVLEMRIEIVPAKLPEGYPWNAYYGARFAWRDERVALLRGVNGAAEISGHTRPETPDFIELRGAGALNTVVFPEGLPFHQRHGSRMLDVILVPPGEAARSFDLALGLDREYPMQTALGLATPAPVVRTEQGPPHVGATGWLFHMDAMNLLLSSLRPIEGQDAVLARLLECTGQSGAAEFRCARNPVKAAALDARGQVLLDAPVQGDAVQLDVTRNELMHLRIDFS
jgi:hypothetical protein